MSYWFDADDFDEFPEFYLQVHRAKMKNLETESYASFGRSCLMVVQDKLRTGDVKYVRYSPFDSNRDFIYGRVSVDVQVFYMDLESYVSAYGDGYPEYLAQIPARSR